MGDGEVGEGDVAGTVARDAKDLSEVRLVNGWVAGVPASDAAGVFVDYSNADAGVLEGDDGGSWASYNFSVS